MGARKSEALTGGGELGICGGKEEAAQRKVALGLIWVVFGRDLMLGLILEKVVGA